jgi:predicted alpha/beta superfamily hydrolase
MRLGIGGLLLLIVSCAQASSPHKEVVTFSITNDVGFGNSVFVVGNHPDLGAWDVTHAIKLRFTTGNVWTGQIAIQAGTQLQYSYIKRSTAQDSWCDSANAVYLTGVLTQSIAAQPPAPYIGKTIYYLSSWNSADLVYNNSGTFVGKTMTKLGPGRTAGESLFKISGVGEPGELIEFVFSDGNGNFDNPPGGGNYLTSLDVFEVQDGNVFSYLPPATVSAPVVLAPHLVGSSVPNIPDRNVRVYLPRGYNENANRRYPVVYFEDGQNVFDPSTAFGHVEWQADETATREIGQGRMREAILVGIYNTPARIPEYQPPNDSYQGTQGRGDAYADYVINNVRPYIDNTYRTLNDPKNTITIGSSLGGLISLYFGREFTTFGKIAVVSPALWISPKYVKQVQAQTKKPLRVHLDMGTSEGQSDFDNCLSMYDTHLAQNYAANGDVEFVAGCGQQHNEAAWSVRLPGILDYLLPAREDPPELAQRDYPPRLSITALSPSTPSASFNYTSLFGFTYTFQRSSNLANWNGVSVTPPETLPWFVQPLNDGSFSGTPEFWRLQANPAP